MKELAPFRNYYEEWTKKRVLREDEIYFKEKTLVIQSSAWNLNILLVIPEEKSLTEYNRPFNLPLDPFKIRKHQEKNIELILPEIIEKLSGSNVNYIYCRGPGLALSLSSVVFLYEKIKNLCTVIPYSVFHGISHLSEVLIKNMKKKYLFCYFSGGTTQFILKDQKGYLVIAETLDITIGNLLDIYTKNYFQKKPMEIKINPDEIFSYIPTTFKYCRLFPAYFNLSGIEKIMQKWPYAKLLSFIVNLLLKFIIEIKQKNVFFSGGVFNSEELRETLIRSRPRGYFFYFEENNSDKAYMHVLNQYLNKIQPASSVNYDPKLRIVDDFTPIRNSMTFNLPNNLKEFLNYFSSLDNKTRRKLIFYLNERKNQKKEKSYLKVLSYRRHLPLK